MNVSAQTRTCVRMTPSQRHHLSHGPRHGITMTLSTVRARVAMMQVYLPHLSRSLRADYAPLQVRRHLDPMRTPSAVLFCYPALLSCVGFPYVSYLFFVTPLCSASGRDLEAASLRRSDGHFVLSDHLVGETLEPGCAARRGQRCYRSMYAEKVCFWNFRPLFN